MTLNHPPDLQALKREARHKATSAQRLLELAALDPQVSRAVAGNKTAPLPVLEGLARSSDMPTRRAVAANAGATAALLNHLSKDRQWTVLKAVAVHPHTDAPTLERLSVHSRDTVKTALLGRSNLLSQVLETLGRDQDAGVRREVAWSSALPAPLIRALYADGDAGVRANIVQHDTLSAAQKRQALADPEAVVRASALRALAGLLPAAGSLTEAELWDAVRDPDETVRLCVADLLADDYARFHKFLPASTVGAIADTLLRDPADEVRIVAAMRADPALLPELRPLLERELAQGSYVLGMVFVERCADPDITRALLERGDSWLLNRMAESAIDPAVYPVLLEDPDHRDSLPGNPHIPDAFWIAVGERILADPDVLLPLLPLMKRALSSSESGPRPDLFRWFTAHLDTLLTFVPHFEQEQRVWRSFDRHELRSIVSQYLQEEAVADVALGALDRFNIHFPTSQGETP